MTTGMFYIDKLAFIYLKNGKLLVTLNHGKESWYIPGGKRESGESDAEALIREVKEELSVDLLPDTIRQYGTFEVRAHGKPVGTLVRMTCYLAEFKGEFKPAAEVLKIDFFSFADISRISLVDQIIFDDLRAKGLLK